MSEYTLLHGDCLTEMAAMDAGSVDAVVCDPPYALTNRVADVPACDKCGRQCGGGDRGRGGKHLKVGDPCPRCGTPLIYRRTMAGSGFMGKDWDNGLVAFSPEMWAEALRVIKPSHYLLAFGGTRTWHRLACAIEDAGFEIRDTLMWLYGSGFPKGRSCLKPAWEPIILARKPGPMRELGIEECRVGTVDSLNGGAYAKNGSPRHDGSENWSYKREGGAGEFEQPAGRWPANLILDEEAGAMLDGQSGPGNPAYHVSKTETSIPNYGNAPSRVRPVGIVTNYGDSGGASRFFYCAKASRSERNAGCEGMEERQAHDDDWVSKNRLDQPCEGKRSPQGNHHPTVKPLALMRWLVKLVAQPGDVVLDPFMGSGTTGVACAMEGREFIGIEREAEYVEIARRRIEAASAQGRLTLDESPPLPPVAGRPT